MAHTQIIAYLAVIARATIDPSLAPAHLDSLEKRVGAARVIGEVLNKRGGFNLMRTALESDLGWCPGCRTIERYWHGIGSWLG